MPIPIYIIYLTTPYPLHFGQVFIFPSLDPVPLHLGQFTFLVIVISLLVPKYNSSKVTYISALAFGPFYL
jgi:hypothetical protein